VIYLGLSRKSGLCGICKVRFPPGTKVYHNTEISQGKHLAHAPCWEKLSASRPRKFTGKKTVTASHEELDPPY
jgi:hypothetical protein